MERGVLESPIRRATKQDFLRSIISRRPATAWSRRGGSRQERAKLQADMVNLQSILKAEAMNSLTRGFKGVFTKQLQNFQEQITRIGNGTILRNKANGNEWTAEEIAIASAVLSRASANAFGQSLALQGMARGHFQSFIDRSYSRVGFLLGEADGFFNANLPARNEIILGKLNRVQEATKRMADFHIAKAFEDAQMFRLGVAWGEVGLIVGSAVGNRITIPSRLTTLARTEGSRAVDEGVKEAVKSSGIVSHMSVIGCKAVEPNIPTYRGEPTCNIEDVPTVDVDMVEFHVNHTGAWVASRFSQAGVTGTAV